MFQQPKTTGVTYVAPAQPIDVDQRYLVKVVELADVGVSKFQKPDVRPGEEVHRIQWKFHMADIQGNKVLDIDGNPYIHIDYTNNTTGRGTTTATARLWFEALFGKPLEDNEISGAAIANEVRGKTAVVLFEEKQKTDDGGQPYTSLSILKMSPRKAGAAMVAAEETKAAADNAQATVNRARAAVAEPPESDGELPW